MVWVTYKKTSLKADHFTITAKYERERERERTAPCRRLYPYCRRGKQRLATSSCFTHATHLRVRILSDFPRWSRLLTRSPRRRLIFNQKLTRPSEDLNHQGPDHQGIITYVTSNVKVTLFLCTPQRYGGRGRIKCNFNHS
jgi:hypothetical protein